MLNPSNSSSESDSSSEDETDGTSSSNPAVKRIKKVLRKRRHRTSTSSLKDARSTPSMPCIIQSTPSRPHSRGTSPFADLSGRGVHSAEAMGSGHGAGAVDDLDAQSAPENSTSFEKIVRLNPTAETRHKQHHKDPRKPEKNEEDSRRIRDSTNGEGPSLSRQPVSADTSRPSHRVARATDATVSPEISSKRRFDLHGLSSRPPVPRFLSTATFLHSPQSGPREGPAEPSHRAMPDRPPLRRTTSLPDRLNGSFAWSQLLLAARRQLKA